MHADVFMNVCGGGKGGWFLMGPSCRVGGIMGDYPQPLS